MPDWLSSMQQTFEHYSVNPHTWKDDKQIDNVTSSSISRDSDAETLGSATIDIMESVGECYIRTYLVTNQNGVTEKHPLGTHLVQTPSSSFDGKTRSVSMDAFTPLLELKEDSPPIGYYIPKNTNVMDIACRLTREHARAPVIPTESEVTLTSDFVAYTDDSWLTYLSDLISNAKYSFGLDEMGRILFLPDQDTASLQPVWTYTDDNSSILLPSFDMEHDLYGVPNVVEVIYSEGNMSIQARVVNDDPNSPTSTVNRGREILYRDTNPSILGYTTQLRLNEYAERLLREKSSLEYTVTYTHGYCPVRVGDCVRLNYTRAGLTDIKAKVLSQDIDCNTGCLVTETAKFTMKLWG